MLPSRRVRRFTGPLLIAALVAAVVSLPVLVVVAVIVSVWLPGRWHALRLLGFALVYLAAEVAGLAAAWVLWALSGFGRRSDSPAFRRAHYTMLRLLLDVLMRTAQRLFALRLVTDGTSWSPLDDGVPGSTNAMVVLSRHAGPGDSFLLVHTLMNRDHLRRPRIVLKDLLQLDPLIDVYLNRLPSTYVASGPGAGPGSSSRGPAGAGTVAPEPGVPDAGPVGGSQEDRRPAARHGFRRGNRGRLSPTTVPGGAVSGRPQAPAARWCRSRRRCPPTTRRASR